PRGRGCGAARARAHRGAPDRRGYPAPGPARRLHRLPLLPSRPLRALPLPRPSVRLSAVRRRTFLGTLGAGLLAAPLAVEAQPPANVPRIGLLSLNLAPNRHLREAFRQGLRDLGYVEGHNVVVESRDAEGNVERLPALAAELVALKVDVIVTGGGTPPALAAKQATTTPPHCVRLGSRSGYRGARRKPCAAGGQC